MARHLFGGGIADWTFTEGGAGEAVLASTVTVTFWDDITGGTQYTDLTTLAGAAIDSVVSGDGTGETKGQIPQFYGPDAITFMWASANGGPRALVVATDLGNDITAQLATLLAVQSQLAGHIAAANPHGTRTSNLLDFSGAAPTDGQIPQFVSASGLWVPTTVSGLSAVLTSGDQTVTGLKSFQPNDINESAMEVRALGAGFQVADLFAAFWWNGTTFQRTGYFNEKGELRARPGAANSIAFRAFAEVAQTARIMEINAAADGAGAGGIWAEPDARRWRASNLGFLLTWSVLGNLVAGTGKHRIYNDSGVDLSIRACRASAGTPPTGQPVIIDVNDDGTTIFTTQANRPTIAAGANTSGSVTSMNDTTWQAGHYLTVDVDQIGSGTAGADLVVQVLAY